MLIGPIEKNAKDIYCSLGAVKYTLDWIKSTCKISK